MDCTFPPLDLEHNQIIQDHTRRIPTPPPPSSYEKKTPTSSEFLEVLESPDEALEVTGMQTSVFAQRSFGQASVFTASDKMPLEVTGMQTSVFAQRSSRQDSGSPGSDLMPSDVTGMQTSVFAQRSFGQASRSPDSDMMPLEVTGMQDSVFAQRSSRQDSGFLDSDMMSIRKGGLITPIPRRTDGRSASCPAKPTATLEDLTHNFRAISVEARLRSKDGGGSSASRGRSSASRCGAQTPLPFLPKKLLVIPPMKLVKPTPSSSQSKPPAQGSCSDHRSFRDNTPLTPRTTVTSDIPEMDLPQSFSMGNAPHPVLLGNTGFSHQRAIAARRGALSTPVWNISTTQRNPQEAQLRVTSGETSSHGPKPKKGRFDPNLIGAEDGASQGNLAARPDERDPGPVADQSQSAKRGFSNVD